MIKAKPGLKDHRIKEGLYQKEVADKIGISANTYSLIETGNRPTGSKTAKSICLLFKKQFEDLFIILPKEGAVSENNPR